MPYVGKSMDRKRNAHRRQLSGAHTAMSWNAAHPVGTAVRYWPIYPPIEGVPPRDTTTRSEAWTRRDGSVDVLVDGVSEGVSLSHVEVLSRNAGSTHVNDTTPTRPKDIDPGDCFCTPDPEDVCYATEVTKNPPG